MKRKFVWITNPQYKYKLTFIKDHPLLFDSNLKIFVTSCSEVFASYFKKYNFQSIRIAKEAILFLNEDHFKSKSLKELVRRGKKRGKTKEINFSIDNQEKVEEFKKSCTHGSEPQLKYLFSDKFKSSNRLFVFSHTNEDLNDNEKWLGAITISIFNKEVFTHLILRRKKSPVGIMEALIFDIFNKLKEENYFSWSLGDVPFVIYDGKFPSKEFMINFLGRRFKYAYNYPGLYNFKNKFHPVWRDSYFCSKPKIGFKELLMFSNESHFSKLILYKLKTQFN